MCTFTKSEIFKLAHRLARESASQFGNYAEAFKFALANVYANVKASIKHHGGGEILGMTKKVRPEVKKLRALMADKKNNRIQGVAYWYIKDYLGDSFKFVRDIIIGTQSIRICLTKDDNAESALEPFAKELNDIFKHFGLYVVAY